MPQVEVKVIKSLMEKLSSFLKISISLAVFLSAGSAAIATTSPVLNVFLVQNSGWMEPFYTDRNSRFKSLVDMVIERVTPRGNEVVLASFNQSFANNRSPLLAYHGRDQRAIMKALQDINLAKKPGEDAYADTDFKEAVIGAITQYSPGRPCILWIFTNNKNSPNNSLEIAARNKEFYKWLHSESHIKRIIAYPYRMAVKGPHYRANGLMIYAMAYGEPANERLKQLIADRCPFKDRPARLKPLNSGAITFVPNSVANKGNFSAALGADRKTLMLQFDSPSRPEVAVIKGIIINDFYPYDICSADLSLHVTFYGESHGIQSSIEPYKLVSLASGEQSPEVTVMIGIPPLPNMWEHPEIILKSGYQAKAKMEFTLANQRLRISPNFIHRMEELFPGDPLPEIFVPSKSAKQSVTDIPLLVSVVYPTWPLVALALILFVIVCGGVWLLTAVTRPRKYTVVIDGIQKVYHLKVFDECTVYSDRGDRIGTLKRRLGKPATLIEDGRKEQVHIL